jgi:DNA-binding NarL/FixJ family response regulator
MRQRLELTERELEVVKLLACGASDADIATDLCIAVDTASTHVGNIISKLHANNRTHAAFIALWRSFIPLDYLPTIAAYVPPLIRKEA